MLSRPALDSDLESILAIYNHYVCHSTATFDLAPRTPDRGRRWLQDRGPAHPVIVIEASDRIVGWASLSPWSHHGGYDRTVELSIYVHPVETGHGVGHALMQAVLESARKLGHHCLIARVCSENPRSLAFHEIVGFTTIGTMREVGEKQGRLLDVVLLQKTITP